MKIYIAGPMTGYEDFNFPAFMAAAKELRAKGHECVNPAELCPEVGKSWEYYMRKDLTGMLECDAIYLLQGWDKSRGAYLEKYVADALSMDIIYQADFKVDSDGMKP